MFEESFGPTVDDAVFLAFELYAQALGALEQDFNHSEHLIRLSVSTLVRIGKFGLAKRVLCQYKNRRASFEL